MSWSTLILVIVYSIWLAYILKERATFLILNSKSSKLKWLRKFYWLYVVDRIRSREMGSIPSKARYYFMDYIRNSVATREYYIKYGYDALMAVLIGKIEELERFVEKYKYNTFDNLSQSQIDFIENYERQEKEKRRRSL